MVRSVFESRRLAWPIVTVMAGGLVGSGPSVAARAQPTTDGRTVRDGVYSPDQAQRGSQQYAAACAGCRDRIDRHRRAGGAVARVAAVDRYYRPSA